ncbi:MAG: GGDEF domain-containing protein [Alphaproteobacteria bacterium]
MKIDGTRKTNEAAHAAYRSTVKATGGGQARVVRFPDSSTVLGIPDGELTPKVRHAIESLMAEVERLRNELAEQTRRIGYLERLADEDSLVPVANRRAFVRELGRMFAYAERYKVSGAVLYFDINDMKTINDKHGHGAGDAALSLVANVLIEQVRESDIVGRLGGDEFGVLLAQTDQAGANEKAERLASAIIDRPLQWNGGVIPITLSYGAHAFSGGDNPISALEAADRAMYVRKQMQRPA